MLNLNQHLFLDKSIRLFKHVFFGGNQLDDFIKYFKYFYWIQ